MKGQNIEKWERRRRLFSQATLFRATKCPTEAEKIKYAKLSYIKRKQIKQNFYSCTTMANIEKATETKSKRHMQKSIWKQEIKKIYSPHDKNITAHSQWAVKNLLQSKKCPNFADVLLHAWPLFVQIIFFTLINAKAWVFAVNRFSQFIGRGFTNRSKSRIYLSNNVVHCHFSLRKYRKLL